MILHKGFLGGTAILALSSIVIVAGQRALAQTSATTVPIEQGKNDACLACHGPEGMFEAGNKLIVSDDKVKHSVHKDLTCTDCHSAFTTSPHAKTATKKVDCLSCHEETMTQNTLPRPDPPGKFRTSVHWPKTQVHPDDLPQCLNCHSDDAHDIQKPQLWTKKLVADKCAKCHADKAKMDRHGVHVEAALSYFNSFHGKAIKYGSQETATCVDCHNAHGVRNPKDELATTNKANLQETCRHCHKGTSYNFAMAGTGHLDLTLEHSLPLRLTNWFFIGIAVFTFTMLSIALLLDLRRRMAERKKTEEGGEEPPASGDGSGGNGGKVAAVPMYVERWSPTQRCQHGMLTVSITLLILTGFPLRFPDATGMSTIYSLFGGIGTARVVHRMAAIMLVVVAVWHLAMLLSRWAQTRVHPRDWPMLFNRQDWADLKQTLRYYFGKRGDLPKFSRYSFREKIDYMCEYWGVPVMVLSGLILWLPGMFAERLPGVVISMAYVAHGIEATIAATVILVWHMYNALVASGIRGNTAWWNGKVTDEYMRHHHPLEWERLTARANPAPSEAEVGE